MTLKNQDAVDIGIKYGSLLLYILIGFIGTLGFDILTKKKITRWYIFGTGCCALFAGFVAGEWLMNHHPNLTPYLTPVATLVAKDMILFFKMIDWQGVLKLLTGKNTKKIN